MQNEVESYQVNDDFLVMISKHSNKRKNKLDFIKILKAYVPKYTIKGMKRQSTEQDNTPTTQWQKQNRKQANKNPLKKWAREGDLQSRWQSRKMPCLPPPRPHKVTTKLLN